MEQTGLQRKHIPPPPRGQMEPQLEQRYIWSSFICEKIILRKSNAEGARSLGNRVVCAVHVGEGQISYLALTDCLNSSSLLDTLLQKFSSGSGAVFCLDWLIYLT